MSVIVSQADPAAAEAVRAGRRARRVRVVCVTLVLALLVLATFCVSLSVGDFTVPLGDVVTSLFGFGDPAATFVVRELRLPRALLAVLVGLAFGLSGNIFQTLLRNPLASPDVIGITSGASAAAVTCIVVLGLGGVAVALGAFAGALATALTIYLLAWRDGVTGYRLVLIGIAIGAMLVSVVEYVITRAQITDAQEALVWITGSLNGATWSSVSLLTLLMVVLVPLALLHGRYLLTLQTGDELARGLGVPLERARLALIVVAVALAAVATAATGPIAFVAFVSGPIAKRLVGHQGLALVPAMLVGSLVVLLSDLVAQHAVPGASFPVGVVTGLVGAPYLIWLLISTNRGGRGG